MNHRKISIIFILGILAAVFSRDGNILRADGRDGNGSPQDCLGECIAAVRVVLNACLGECASRRDACRQECRNGSASPTDPQDETGQCLAGCGREFGECRVECRQELREQIEECREDCREGDGDEEDRQD